MTVTTSAVSDGGGDTVVDVADLDLPVVDPDIELDRVARTAEFQRCADDGHWILRGAFGYPVIAYDDVTAILRDKRWHNAVRLIIENSGITDEEIVENRRESILSAEGDVHMRLRRLVGQAFSPRSADRLRPVMREVVDGLIDDVAEAGRADVAVDICEPYPIPIICELLGAPKEDWQLFSRWAEDVLRIFNNNVADELEPIKVARRELDAYTIDMIEQRRGEPRDDLLSDLIAAEEAGDKLDNEELVSMVNAVIVGGTDTTRNQLSCAIGIFAEHPEQWALLAERPELAPQAVEEVMRFAGAVRGTGRYASEDIVYRGVRFPAGTLVFPALAAANREEVVVADGDPLVFDITREPVKGRPQMTFGAGIHYCLGASLARAELQEALTLMSRRMPDLRLDGTPVWKPPTAAIFGAEHLPVRFTPGH